MWTKREGGESAGPGSGGTDRDDGYDPYENRNRPAPITNLDTFFHMVKSVLGIGLLAAPDSFYNTGTLFGNVALMIVGVIATYCLHVLVVDYYWMVIDLRIWMLILYPLLLGLCMIKNLKKLAPFSQVAILIQLVALIIVLYYVFQNMPPISDRPAFASPMKWPLFYGTVLFSIEAIGVMVSLENNMKTPGSWGGYFGVLNAGMIVVCIIYWFMGFFGYWKYGDASNLGSLTLNIPRNAIPAQISKVLYSFSVVFTFALQCWPVIEIMWEHYLEKRYPQRATLVSYIIRITTVTISLLVALVIPHLALMVSLTGVVSMSLLCLTFPGLLELVVLWPNLGPCYIVLWRDLFFIIAGFVAFVIGTFIALKEVFER